MSSFRKHIQANERKSRTDGFFPILIYSMSLKHQGQKKRGVGPEWCPPPALVQSLGLEGGAANGAPSQALIQWFQAPTPWRSSLPEVAPVHFSPSNVTSPLTMVYL